MGIISTAIYTYDENYKPTFSHWDYKEVPGESGIINCPYIPLSIRMPPNMQIGDNHWGTVRPMTDDEMDETMSELNPPFHDPNEIEDGDYHQYIWGNYCNDNG